MTIEFRWAILALIIVVFVIGRISVEYSLKKDRQRMFTREEVNRMFAEFENQENVMKNRFDLMQNILLHELRFKREISSSNKTKDIFDYFKFSEPYGLIITGGINYIELEMYLDYSKQIDVARTTTKKRIDKVVLNEEVMMGMLEIMKRELELRTK